MTPPAALHRLSASEGARLIAAREITSEALVRSCLECIEARESVVQAWAFLDPEIAIAQARERDRVQPIGTLHGVPIGVKDVIDTADMPTEYNSPIYSGHRPFKDALCVARARAAGAVILGKTVTTEFAYIQPAKTTNPHNSAHTPGGSSSGSAAAVGAWMIPLALGTQTGGSTIRPAAYCGAFGFKPTYNRVAFAGIKSLSSSFDTVGMIARSVDDIALLESALTGAPSLDQSRGLRRPKIGYCKTPFWKEAEESTRRALAQTAELLEAEGADVEEVSLPEQIRELNDGFGALLAAEAACSLGSEYRRHRTKLSRELRETIEAGLATAPNEVQRVRRVQMRCAITVDRIIEAYDAFLTPTCPGEAEKDHAIGSNVFNRMWTAMHMPCLTIPCGTGPNALPIGVQLVGRASQDRQLLRLARRVSGWLLGEGSRLPSQEPRRLSSETQTLQNSDQRRDRVHRKGREAVRQGERGRDDAEGDVKD